MQLQFTLANGVPVVRLAHLELTCETCGRVFFRKRSKVKGALTFCSNTCKWVGQRTLADRTCARCGALVPRDALPKRPKYCSRACSVAARTSPASERLWQHVRKTAG